MQASGSQFARIHAQLAPIHDTHNNQTKDSQECCAPAMAKGGERFLGVFHLSVHGEFCPGDWIVFPLRALCISVM
jgi:hypothetical protein